MQFIASANIGNLDNFLSKDDNFTIGKNVGDSLTGDFTKIW